MRRASDDLRLAPGRRMKPIWYLAVHVRYKENEVMGKVYFDAYFSCAMYLYPLWEGEVGSESGGRICQAGSLPTVTRVNHKCNAPFLLMYLSHKDIKYTRIREISFRTPSRNTQRRREKQNSANIKFEMQNCISR